MDELRLDSHKLIFHPEAVSDWLKGKNIYPIFLDVSPTSACNHRCIFCGLDFAHGKAEFLGTDILKKTIKDLARGGTKSVMYAGEGEPLLHKDMAGIIMFTKKNGIDASLATNAVLMNEKFLEAALKYLTWIRISIDGGTPETYSMVHGCAEKDFEKSLANIETAVRIKKKNNLDVTVGTQFLLLNENKNDVCRLAGILKKIGVDYFSVKPYSKHPLSINNAARGLDYSKMIYLEKKLEKFNSPRFRVIFRRHAMEKRFKVKPYKRCLGIPFWAYISASGDVYPCHTYLSLEKYSFGNLNKQSFPSIWNGAKRKKVMNYFNNKMDAAKCRELCRLDEINAYLWQLKHPHAHVNFI